MNRQMTGLVALTLAALLGAAILSACGSKPIPPEQQAFYEREWGNLAESRPVLDKDFPDPDILQVGGWYYAFATIANGKNIQAASSQDLVHWTLLPDALPVLPPWAFKGDTWAPDVSVAKDGKTFRMYFVAKSRKTGRQCIGVATSSSPSGPFQSDAKEPLVCQVEEGGSIDPASFVDRDGQSYLLWKNDGNCCDLPTWIYLQKTSEDGLSLVGEASRLITTSLAWEGDLIEAPGLWRKDGKYYLFYSANAYYDDRYAVGAAVADQIQGPYTKLGEPVLSSKMGGSQWIGPGGQDVVTGPDGDTYLAFHSWDKYQIKRAMYLEKLYWVDDRPSLIPNP